MNTIFMREVGYVKWLTRTISRQFYKRLLRHEQTMKLPSGDRIALPPNSRFASEVYITGADVDWGSENLLFHLLARRGAFLDVGANIGYYSLYMHRRATHVYAFEPDPRARRGLERNVAQHEDIDVVPSAVSDHKGTGTLVLESSTEISHLSRERRSAKPQLDVDIITIDGFVADHALTVEAIKTDVEGSDVQVLMGARKTLAGQRPLVLTEAQFSPDLAALAQEIDYSILCYARDRSSRQISFLEVSQLTSEQVTKMLFLVPGERTSEVRLVADSFSATNQ